MTQTYGPPPPQPRYTDQQTSYQEPHSFPDHMMHNTLENYGTSPSTPVDMHRQFYAAAMPIAMPAKQTMIQPSNSFGSFSEVTMSYDDYRPAPPGSPVADLLSLEKRRKRRESHNAVERRRRDNINDKIQELNYLVPDDPSAAMSTGSSKPNKGIDPNLT